jgi:hypothetical protein
VVDMLTYLLSPTGLMFSAGRIKFSITLSNLFKLKFSKIRKSSLYTNAQM